LLSGQLPDRLDQRGARTTPPLIGVESEDLALPPVRINIRRAVGIWLFESNCAEWPCRECEPSRGGGGLQFVRR